MPADGKFPTAPRGASECRALLQVWLSPSFPVGAFAYSHGLEKAVENGWIVDRSGLQAWIADLIGQGSLRNDLVLLAASWRATHDPATGSLSEVAETAIALQPSRERRLEAMQQGASFLIQIEAAWPTQGPDWRARVPDRALTPTLPVAVGFAAANHGVDLLDTATAYAVGFTGTLTSAAIRLGVIGQTDGQRIIAALMAEMLTTAAFAARSTTDDLGGAAWRSDIAAMQHETQHTRLFRS